MSQNVRCDVRERRVLEDLLPIVGEAAKGIIVAISWEDKCAGRCLSTLLKKLDNG
jgi:hypothetical protein